MRKFADYMGLTAVGPRPSGAAFHASRIWVAGSVLALVGGTAGCRSSRSDSSAPVRMIPEQATSYSPAARVGAERGEAEPTLSEDREADLEVSVDLGTSEALAEGSELLVELSDVTNKDEPKRIATQRVDVSGKQGAVPVTVRLPANALLEAERVALTGRVDSKGVMHAISPVPVVVDGPFEIDGTTATLTRAHSLTLALSQVPDYQKPPPPKRIVVPVHGTESVDTGQPTSVVGPRPKAY